MTNPPLLAYARMRVLTRPHSISVIAERNIIPDRALMRVRMRVRVREEVRARQPTTDKRQQTMKLRDYQQAAVNAVIETWKTAKSCLIVRGPGTRASAWPGVRFMFRAGGFKLF